MAMWSHPCDMFAISFPVKNPDPCSRSLKKPNNKFLLATKVKRKELMSHRAY